MNSRNPLKQILSQARPHWDRDVTRPPVRAAFVASLKCGTTQLGAEVFASENHEFILCHRRKSRGCPSCGYRASVQWLRERYAAMPDVLYKGITFTMPKELWPLFHDNPSLVRALPALAAAVIETYVSGRYGLHVGIITILHTFHGKLEFNSHVHTMVTSGGLHLSSATWIASVYYDRDALTHAWRKSGFSVQLCKRVSFTRLSP